MRAYPALAQDLRCEVVVLGGGITGALIAYHLVEAGVDTVVLDKRDIGWGSTSASTALLQYEIDTPLCDLSQLVGEDHAARAYLACRDAIGKLEAVVHQLDDASGWMRCKSLYFASTRRHVNALKEEFAIRRKYGIALDWLDEHDLSAQMGLKQPAALLSHDAAQVDAYRLTHALLRAAAAKGLRVYDRTEAMQINTDKAGVCIETNRGFSVRGRKLVFATGYESQTYLKHDVAKLISTFALVSEPISQLSETLTNHLIWESARPYLYMRSTPEGRLIVGGEDEGFRDPFRRDRLIGRKAHKLQQRMQKLFPDLPLEVAFAWAGTFGETKDGLAYIGPTPEWPEAYFALGYGGNGITYSVLAAEIIRDAILQRHNPYADLFCFDR
jgi:glycine/D-amino acid oxidase-like deaminating enzyme